MDGEDSDFRRNYGAEMDDVKYLQEMVARLRAFLNGSIDEELPPRPEGSAENAAQEELCALLREEIELHKKTIAAVERLSRGDVVPDPSEQNPLFRPVRVLQTRLSHLIWQTRQLSANHGVTPGRVDTLSSPIARDAVRQSGAPELPKHESDFFEEFSAYHNDLTRALQDCRRIGDQLAESNRQQEILINTLPAFIYFKDVNLRYQLVNNAYSGIIGLEPSDLTGKCDDELPFDPSVKIYEKIDREIITSKKPQMNIIKQHLKAEGSLYWSSTSKVPYCNAAGEVIGIIGIVQDITDQKNAEIALKESEKKYRIIADNTLDVIWMIDLATLRYSYVSPSVHAVRGYTPEEVMNAPLEHSFTAESYSSVFQIIRDSAALAPDDPKYNIRIRAQQPCKDGRIIDIEAVASIIRDDGGNPVELLGISRDISTHVKIEEQNEVIKLLLREFEENAGDWLWELDNEGRLTYVSVRMAQLFHKTTDELYGKKYTDIIASTFERIDEDDEKRLRSFSRRLRNPMPFREFMLTIRIDGVLRWWMLTGKPLISSSGEVRGWRGVGRDVTERKLHEEETERQANIDTLTGLANRYYLHKFFQGYFIAADRYISRSVLLHFSIDNLKIINAIFGHLTVETILQRIADRMREFSQKTEVLAARIAREEFAVFFMSPSDDFHEEASEFLSMICKPIAVGNESLELRASAGYVVFPDEIGDNEITPERIFQCAEMAFEAAKENGVHTLRAYDRELAEHELHKLAIINELGRALDRNEFKLVYQPQVSVLSGKIVGVESLIRWNSPVLGNVSPSEFIPLAEQNGMMVNIGRWILLQACRDAQVWPAPLHVSVNVSSGQFMSNSFVGCVMDSLADSGLAANRLKLEITESSLIGNSVVVRDTLIHLREKGIRISLDDFGTGYSSLSYLRSFPLDELKIDQSFVLSMERDPESIAIVETIIRLAKTLNLSTTAEGVETPFEAEYLKRFGCDHYQGFLYNKPIFHEQIMQLNNF